MNTAGLPRAEFAFAGPLRDALVAAILRGEKTSTTSLAIEYSRDGEPLPQVEARQALVDSNEVVVAVIETSAVAVVPLNRVDVAHARDEGEGHTTVADWRRGHEEFWRSDEMRASLGDPSLAVDDDTEVVLERFVVVERLDY